MKHTNKTLKTILAMVLTLAIALTGISLNNTAAYAATDDQYVIMNLNDKTDIKNKTVTIQSGDQITIQYILNSSSGVTVNMTDKYEWKSSDESVVSILKEYSANIAGDPEVWQVRIRAEKEGTATITGTSKNTNKTESFTVIVKAPDATAKQKSCKHAWKTTRKATCVRNGVKTCKKCKLQKAVNKKSHKFVTKNETETLYDTYPIYVCQHCVCEDEVHLDVLCTNLCGEEFDAKDYDTDGGNLTWDDVDAAYEAYKQHKTDNNHGTGSISEYVGYANPHNVTQKVTRCKLCGQTKEQIKNAGQ